MSQSYAPVTQPFTISPNLVNFKHKARTIIHGRFIIKRGIQMGQVIKAMNTMNPKKTPNVAKNKIDFNLAEISISFIVF